MLAGFAGLFFGFMFEHRVDGLDLGPCVYRDAGKPSALLFCMHRS